MLESVIIKDFALIEAISLEFERGFTVLSGETGAGKSILIGALSFLLGGKGGAENIRAGAGEASVSGTFFLDSCSRAALEWLDTHGIEPDESRVLLRRFVRSNGRGGAWIQNTPVTRTELAEFSSFLVDIHGQHEHQSLLRVAEHQRYLDAYAGLTEETAAFTVLYAELVNKRRQLDEISVSGAEQERQIELLTFALNEIDGAKLREGEDDELAAEENRLSQFERIFEETDSLSVILTGQENGHTGEPDSVLSALKRAQTLLSQTATIDTVLEPLASRLENVFYEITDIAGEIRAYRQALVFDPVRLESVQERLALLFKLKKKYAASIQSPIAEVIAYGESARCELDKLSHSEQNRDELAETVSLLEKKVYAAAKQLSEKRHAAAEKMSREVESVLSVLGMGGAVFAVSITDKPGSDNGIMQKCGPQGMDDVEFLISANTGSPPKPLVKIASGGELSRVMLALKTILADSDTVGTLIFDEIDTGIGGEVSVSVGAHLQMLSQKRQILCITHVASIAAHADNQIKIEKNSTAETTVTHVSVVSGRQRIEEIARMLSGDSISAASLDHAAALLSKFGR